MTSLQYRLLGAFSLVCCLLAFSIMGLGFYNHHLETRVAIKQAEINQLRSEIERGAVSQRYAQGILQDLIGLGTKPDVQAMLARYNVSAGTKKTSNSPTP